MIYLDAGTTYSKIISTEPIEELRDSCVNRQAEKFYYIFPSKKIGVLGLKIDKSCGHMTGVKSHENEIIALAKGVKGVVESDATVLDLGSRDAKWIRFKDGKFHDMDWNTSCASSTGATVEMLLKFYDLTEKDLKFHPEKFAVTCGIFGLEKIMDDISNGASAAQAVSKFIHGIAFNAWTFAKKPNKLYLSGGFCENGCLVESLENYCDVVKLGRFKLCEGLANE